MVFFNSAITKRGGGGALWAKNTVQQFKFLQVYIEVKWSHFTSTNANTNSTVTSLRVCYFCMSWKQQLDHQTRSLLKHQTYFCNCIYWCIITFCTRSRCSCIAFYLGLCRVLYKCVHSCIQEPTVNMFCNARICSNRIIHVHLINYAKKSFIIENKSKKKTSVYVFSIILNFYRDISPSTGDIQ